MAQKVKYTVVSRGCFGDGAFGHQHVRERLATLLEELAAGPLIPEASTRADAEGLAEELRGPMSDDASEEIAGLEMLNDWGVDGVHFDFVDGDLISMPVSDTDE